MKRDREGLEEYEGRLPSGGRALQVDGSAWARALRPKHAWCGKGLERRPVCVKQSKGGEGGKEEVRERAGQRPDL